MKNLKPSMIKEDKMSDESHGTPSVSCDIPDSLGFKGWQEDV